MLPSNVPGLDDILGGGIAQYSLNMIVGAPGTGKTTLAQQIAFALASPERPALYFTVLGEPAIKMLRYAQQMSFFDVEKLDNAVHFVNLSEEAASGDLESMLKRIVAEVDRIEPGIVVVDSFRTVVRASSEGSRVLGEFAQRLALQLTSWQATSFLVGEYQEHEMEDNPLFTIADGILWLSQVVERNAVIRKVQVLKMRGQATMPGLHTLRISNEGLEFFPRAPKAFDRKAVRHDKRLSIGITDLDEMLGGGIPAGDALLVSGPSGSGKSTLATHFIAKGCEQGECGLMAVFEEHPQEYLARAKSLGFDLGKMIGSNLLHMIYLRPLDLSADEVLHEIRETVEREGVSRLVIDSLSGFELALAPHFREDFRESLYRMLMTLTGVGVTVIMTSEVVESFNELCLSSYEISFLADDVILQRYVEIRGELKKAMVVVKMRSSYHSSALRAYQTTARGIEMGPSYTNYRGVILGVPWPVSSNIEDDGRPPVA